jgi:EspG family
VVSGRVTVTVRALATVMRTQRCGELPLALRPAPLATDSAADRADEAAAWAEFGEVGWLDRRGRLDSDVLDSLHVVAYPSVEYTAVFAHDGRQDTAVVATRATDAVLLYREGDAVTVTLMRHGSWPETLLRQIPDARPASVDAVSIRTTDFAVASPGADPFGDDRSPTGHAARTLARLNRRHLVGQGELYVSIRDHYRRARRSQPIRYQDYRIGRVVVVSAGGYLSVAPASKTLLLSRLHDAHRDLTG